MSINNRELGLNNTVRSKVVMWNVGRCLGKRICSYVEKQTGKRPKTSWN